MIMDHIQAEYHAHVSVDMLKELVKKQLESEGYEVLSITMKTKSIPHQVGDLLSGHTEWKSEFDGFEVKAKKKDCPKKAQG